MDNLPNSCIQHATLLFNSVDPTYIDPKIHELQAKCMVDFTNAINTDSRQPIRSVDGKVSIEHCPPFEVNQLNYIVSIFGDTSLAAAKSNVVGPFEMKKLIYGSDRDLPLESKCHDSLINYANNINRGKPSNVQQIPKVTDTYESLRIGNAVSINAAKMP